MDIKTLSISDLYAGLLFCQSELETFKANAKEKNINVNEIDAYEEVSHIEHKLYTELLNRTREIE